MLGNLETPASQHRYIYGLANPTFYIDPDGRSPISHLTDAYTEQRKRGVERYAMAGGAILDKETSWLAVPGLLAIQAYGALESLTGGIAEAVTYSADLAADTTLVGANRATEHFGGDLGYVGENAERDLQNRLEELFPVVDDAREHPTQFAIAFATSPITMLEKAAQGDAEAQIGLIGVGFAPMEALRRASVSGRLNTNFIIENNCSGVVSNKLPLSQAKIDEIRAIPRGQRPEPSEYLSAVYIDKHLSQFDDGAARFMTQRNLEKYGVGQRDGTSFVMTKQEADRLIKTTNGNPTAMEEALGLPKGFLESNQLVRVDIPNPRELNLRIPSGNEAGANDLWIPGGSLPDGSLEAVIDVGDFPSGRFGYTKIRY